MSSFNFTRRAFVLTALASCGFEPVLQSDTLAKLRGKVALPEAKDRASYIMRRERCHWLIVGLLSKKEYK